MKKLVSLLLAILMMASLFSFGAAEEKVYNMPEMNTTDPIHLVYVDQGAERAAVAQFLIEKFCEKYPNITVETVNLTGDYNSLLTNYLAEGGQFDLGCAFYNIGLNVSNKVMYDITEYVENDEEYQTLVPYGLQRYGYVDGERCFWVPGMNLPHMVFLDAAMFERWNVPMPTYDEWNAELMLEYMTSFTDLSQGLFSWSGSLTLPGPLSASFVDNATTEAGYNSKEGIVDFTSWMELYQMNVDMRASSDSVINGSDLWLSFEPDNVATKSSGRVAIYLEQGNQVFSMVNQAMADSGIHWVPYLIPTSTTVENGGQYTNCNAYIVGANTEHPREAYELLKWITWGKEAWLNKSYIVPRLCRGADGLYLAEETYTEAKARCAETGEEMPNYWFAWSNGGYNQFPVAIDEEVAAAWASIQPTFGYDIDWYGLCMSVKNPITAAGRTAIGWTDFWNNVYANGDYNGYANLDQAIWAGAVEPEDYTQMLNEAYLQWHQTALERFYGVYGEP